MYRSIPIGNKLCHKRNEERRFEAHREKLRTMKPTIDTTEPKALRFDHIRNNLKREQMLEERYGEIDRENRILLQKMSDIMRNPSFSLSGQMGNDPSKNPALTRGGPVSLNKDFRKKELLRITHENQKILNRIQKAQPMYNHVKWEEDHQKQQRLLRNCCEYPLVLRSTLPEAAIGDKALDIGVGDGKLADYSKKSGEGEDLRYVLKEGKKIGEAYYLVEMATDGRTLTISAYDGDTQKTLELLVNEKNHRKLYRECNGDYGILASRLHVEKDRLMLLENRPMPSASAKSLNAEDMVKKGNLEVNVGEDGHANVNTLG